MFATLVEAIALQSSRTAVTGVAPAVVVGIGYPTDRPHDPIRRSYDYTPTVPPGSLGVRSDGSAWPQTGGAEEFLNFIDTDVKSEIARTLPVDPARQTLFGHSFGGLFALFALFSGAGTFSTYIAASPSIWFGDRAILPMERDFAERLRNTPRDLHLMIGVGSLEQDVIQSTSAPERAAWIAQNRMVDNAAEMAARLRDLEPHGLTVAYREIAGENHVSVIPALLSPALRFALAPKVA